MSEHRDVNIPTLQLITNLKENRSKKKYIFDFGKNRKSEEFVLLLSVLFYKNVLSIIFEKRDSLHLCVHKFQLDGS